MGQDTTQFDELGQRLATARQRLGLSQAEAAEMTEQLEGGGVQRQTISYWETGRYQPQLSYVLWLCREGDLDPTWLLTGEGQPEWHGEEGKGHLRLAAHYLRQLADRLEDAASEEEAASLPFKRWDEESQEA